MEGLRDLDRLLGQFRSTGLRVEVDRHGELADLPAALDVSAYRIVQEGLTNVLRHGGPTARLALRRTGTTLVIEIGDDGRPAGRVASGPAGPGPGLTGIRERAALFGGTLEADPRPDGGFRLRVELPLEPPVEPR